ncbi:tetratricopeptide repeat protein [Paraburkholderia sp. DHOC27]|uniref:tetratricopeptide repeat protein n=1 Tax=Paraburkholderia sp. DHOC27 TaxID=2303330 RepID=UPI000E3D0028|nr:tetratricopeptide repeat protein [Paraburkholderia sp. DHOC27]RFU49084.1 tetratricopeptide repeat protein [Paraburkholderia sp. DHOC27]
MKISRTFKQAFRFVAKTGRVVVRAVQSGFRGLGYLQKGLVAIGVIAAVAIGLAYTTSGLRPVTVIEPIATPSDLAAEGFTATTSQSRFSEDMLSIINSASSVMPTEIHDTLEEEGTKDVHLQVPDTGMSVLDVVDAIKDMTRRDGRITAEIVWEGKTLWLFGRVVKPGGEAYLFDASSDSGNVNEVIAKGARAAMAIYSPYMLASSVFDQAQKECEDGTSCEYTDAANEFEKVLKSATPKDQTNLAMWANLGLSKIAENNLDYLTEIERARQALRIDRKFSWARYNWGIALENMGCDQEALEKYQRVVSERDRFAAGHNALGREYLKIANHEYVPTDASLRLHARPVALAQQEFEAAIGRDPRYAEAYINLGEALELQGEHGKALDKLRAAIALDGDYTSKAYKEVAKIETQLGDAGRAATASEEAEISEKRHPQCRGYSEWGDPDAWGRCVADLAKAELPKVGRRTANWPTAHFEAKDCRKYAIENWP